MSYLTDVKLNILKCLPKQFGLAVSDFRENWRMENADFGELSLPMFRVLKDGANGAILQKLVTETVWPKAVRHAGFESGFLNFHFNFSIMARQVLTEALPKNKKNKEHTVIEYVAPNTNKPLHLGHLRNAFLGESLARLSEAAGLKTTRTTLYNDRGVPLAKAMVAFLKWGKEIKRHQKGDHWVGDLYVAFEQRAKENPALIEEAQQLVVKWEQGDKKVLALWKKLRDAALAGQQETLAAVDIKFKREYFESQLWDKGADSIKNSLQKKIFELDENKNIVANLENEKLGKKVVLRSNGTAVYITTDIYLVELRLRQLAPTTMLYVVGGEQDLHFKQLFAILRKMKLKHFLKLEHVSYGLVSLPAGRMKSREGTVVDADDILRELELLAMAEIEQRHPELSKKEKMKRSKTIALAAIKYYFLHVTPKNQLQFDPKESVSFIGNTGPYLLYSYARAKSILRKKQSGKLDFALLEKREEKQLVLLLARYEEVLEQSWRERNSAQLAQYLYDLAGVFNDFYHQHPVLSGEPALRSARLCLVERVSQHLAAGLKLLGIKVLERM